MLRIKDFSTIFPCFQKVFQNRLDLNSEGFFNDRKLTLDEAQKKADKVSQSWTGPALIVEEKTEKAQDKDYKLNESWTSPVLNLEMV